MPDRARLRRAGVLCVLAFCVGCGGGDQNDTDAATTTTTPSSVGTQTTTARPAEPQARAPRPEESDEEAEAEGPLGVDQVTIAVLTRSGSPEQGCEEVVTERFVREAYGDRQGCLAAREAGGLARLLEKGTFSEYPNRATGTVVPRGGPYDGVEVEVELVPDPEIDGAWLLDSLLADVPAGP